MRAVHLPSLARAVGFTGYVVLATLALMEVCLRTGLVDSSPYREHQEMRRRLTDRPRVLVLGDSFSLETAGSLGSRVRDYYAARGADTVNLAKTGEGPSFYLDRLRQFGPAVRPRIVIVNYFAGNDLTDTAIEQTSEGRARVWARRLMARSLAVHEVLTTITRVSLERRIARIQASPDARSHGVERTAGREFLVDNILMESETARRAWTANVGHLAAIERVAGDLGAELVVNIFPPDVQVQPGHFRFHEALGIRTDRRFLETTVPQTRLLAICGARGMRCTDVLPALRAASARELYLEQDPHWNAAGHRVAFQAIRGTLDTLDLGSGAPRTAASGYTAASRAATH